jgi:ketopantoate reductase
MAENQNSVELLVQDEINSMTEEETLVIRSSKALRSFFTKVNMTRKPGIPVPEVDFNTNMVVIYCSGKRTDGAKPTINKIRENDTEMVFLANHNTVAGEKQYTVSPFSLFKIPLTDKTIIFEDNKK